MAIGSFARRRAFTWWVLGRGFEAEFQGCPLELRALTPVAKACLMGAASGALRLASNRLRALASNLHIHSGGILGRPLALSHFQALGRLVAPSCFLPLTSPLTCTDLQLVSQSSRGVNSRGVNSNCSSVYCCDDDEMRGKVMGA